MRTHFSLSLLLFFSFFIPASAQDTAAKENRLPVVHPALGTTLKLDSITVELVGRKQNYAPHIKETAEKDIHSPKSVNIHPSGEKYYVNSLEGGTTVVFDFKTGEKLKSIHHRFSQKDSVALYEEPEHLHGQARGEHFFS